MEEEFRVFAWRDIDWMLLVKMSAVHEDNFIPGTPCAYVYIYIYMYAHDCGTRTRISNMGASNYARPYWIIHPRGRQRLSCFFLLFCYTLDERELAPLHLVSFFSFFLPSSFFLCLLFFSNLAKRGNPAPLTREIFSKTGPTFWSFSRIPTLPGFLSEEISICRVGSSSLFPLSFFQSHSPQEIPPKGENAFARLIID